MKKFLLITISLIFVLGITSAQVPADTTNSYKFPPKEKLVKPYHPEENAQQKLDELILKAKKEKKNIFIQAGGNWCGWCLRFNYFVRNEPELNRILDKSFLYYHLNYSSENKNEAIFAKYTEKDKRYGYPFFIILSSKGELLCVQESGIFEEGKGYNAEKVKQFLLAWCPK